MMYDDCEGNSPLWTGESGYYKCTHHIEYHGIVRSLANLLLGKREYKCKKCKECKGFVAYNSHLSSGCRLTNQLGCSYI